MQFVLIGCTGSGKSTLAQALKSHEAIPHISSGDIARTIAEADEATALALKQGLYAPEAAIRLEVQRRVEAAQIRHNGWVLEGFPRRLDQLIVLMGWMDIAPVYVHVSCSTYECVQRLVGRKRPDDTPDGIARKIENFQQETMPVLEVLARSGKLVTVNSTAGANPLEQLLSALDES